MFPDKLLSCGRVVLSLDSARDESGGELAGSEGIIDPFAREWLDHARGVADKEGRVLSGLERSAGQRRHRSPRMILGDVEVVLSPVFQSPNPRRG